MSGRVVYFGKNGGKGTSVTNVVIGAATVMVCQALIQWGVQKWLSNRK